MDNHDNKEKRRPTRVELYDQPNKRPEKKTHFFFDKKADRTAKKEAAPTFKLDKQAKRSSQSNTDLNIKAQQIYPFRNRLTHIQKRRAVA